MTPQELKNSILQYAIEGKLVEQRPEEGNAEELYQQIQAERQRLIAEKKIKKEKPLPEITDDEIPFDIPDNWKWVRLSNICSLEDGKKITQKEFPYLEAKYLRGKIEPKIKSSGKYVEKGKNVILVDGENSGEVFKLNEEGYLGSTFKILYVVDEMFETYFLYFLKLNQRLFRNNKKGAAIPHLNKEMFFNLLLPLPPIEEQKRIVAKIEELLHLVEQYEESYNRLESLNNKFPEDMKKSILQDAIQGKLVEQRPEEGNAEDLYQQIQSEKQRLIAEKKIKKEKPLSEITEDEIPFDIPDNWKWVRLGELTTFQGGYAYKSSSYVNNSTNQIIRLGNIKQGEFIVNKKQVFISDELAKETVQYKILENDILISMTGTRRKKDYFYVVLVNSNMLEKNDFYLNQRVGCFRTISNVVPEYLLHVLQCEKIREIIFTKETGTANQGNLGSEDIKKFVYVPLPPLEEQKRIVAKIEELLPLCDKLK